MDPSELRREMDLAAFRAFAEGLHWTPEQRAMMSAPGTKAADDFDEIRRNLARIRDMEAAAKRKCKKGCGAALDGQHRSGCEYTGRVVVYEVDDLP